MVREDSLHDGYLSARGVNAGDYGDYVLPLYIINYLPDADGKVLDIGCGFGQFLLELKRRGYTDIQGIDIDSESIEYCLSQNINVTQVKSLSSFASLNENAFDLIVMSHVLEHINKPEIIETLRLVRSMLSAEGRLVVMVPNAQSNTHAYWAYEDFTHETIFTSGSISYVLQKAGFTSIEFVDIDCTFGKPLWRRYVIKFLQKLYQVNRHFWNAVTFSAYHAPSPEIYSYEIKVVAK